ncbi:hypothetical protein [Rhizobium sp. G21]|uniref:hypothetical protein n=1 Tax=Rhizobium sp. G21 TaxID=2758439 RepID=UPI001FEFE428|nr:hypothetical protein [Rhizobium sp. G21]
MPNTFSKLRTVGSKSKNFGGQLKISLALRKATDVQKKIGKKKIATTSQPARVRTVLAVLLWRMVTTSP